MLRARTALSTLWTTTLLLLALIHPTAAQPTNRGVGVEAVLGTEVSIPTYHALIIGINEYEHWVDLRKARQDAETVAQVLKADYGFTDIRTLYDRQATRENLIAQLRKLAEDLGPSDALLIYFAGHGYYDTLLGKGYWVLSEAREKAGTAPAVADWFDHTSLREYLGAMKARHVLVLSDSCFSGALFRGGTADLSAKQNTWYQRAIAAPSRWCISSGDLETVPDESVFARKFLQALQYPAQNVFSASDLAGWIKKEVSADSGRQPVFGPLKEAGGSADGEFIFLRTLGTTLRPAVNAHTPPATNPLPEMARFAILSDGKIRDKQTGLTWVYNSKNLFTYKAAVDEVERSGGRLPTSDELDSLYGTDKTGDSRINVDPTFFPEHARGITKFWTSEKKGHFRVAIDLDRTKTTRILRRFEGTDSDACCLLWILVK